MNAVTPGGSSGLLDRVEKLIKLAASVAAITAAIGIPAVYVHYSHLGIPTSLITNEQVFRAGIVPGVLFLFSGAYVLLLIQEYEEGGSKLGAFMVPGILFAPIPVAVVTVIFIGVAAAATWLWWVMIYPVFWLVGLEGTRRIHFWIANGIAFLNIAIPIVWPYVSTFFERVAGDWWRRMKQRPWVAALLHAPRRVQQGTEQMQTDETPATAAEAETAASPDAPATSEGKKEESQFWMIAALVAMFGVYLVGGLFAIRWYLQQLGVEPGPIAEAKAIVIIAIIGAVALATFFFFLGTWKYMRSENKVKRLLVTTLNIGLVVALFGSGVWWYSTRLYPQIPVALGGGKPEIVSVWMAPADLPREIQAALRGARCTSTKATVHCTALQLIHRSSDDVILATSGDGPRAAILVPRKAIQAISW